MAKTQIEDTETVPTGFRTKRTTKEFLDKMAREKSYKSGADVTVTDLINMALEQFYKKEIREFLKSKSLQ